MSFYNDELVGEAPAIAELRHLVRRVAASPARAVLIYGETGTGKGLVARLLHRHSARAASQFVDINCAAIPTSLMEAELFGYERGAFTGAVAKKAGLIESADGGSVFLDEIRELDPTLQAKLLSLLDTQSFRRVGAVRPIEVDVRFIAATNRILLAETHAGNFREDLYYRLQVVAINIPPLRERADDVMVLADFLFRRFADRYGRVIHGFEPEAERILRAYSWPGNVRELENLLERIAILEAEDTVLVRHLPARILREVCGINRTDGISSPPPYRAGPASAAGCDRAIEPFHEATQAFQRQLVTLALSRADGRLSSAARSLGLTRHALRYQMSKLGLDQAS